MSSSSSQLNSTIIYPKVPPEENDPAVRINVMKEIFLAGLPPKNSHAKIDQGFYHEIQTAQMLHQRSLLRSGAQISRPLTAAEKARGEKGDSQMVKVPMEGNRYREIDMVCTGDPTVEPGWHPLADKKTLYLVEAKDTARGDSHQLELNVQLASRMKAGVCYSFQGQKPSREQALRSAYERIDVGGSKRPTLAFINTEPVQFGTNYYDGYGTLMGTDQLPTLKQTLRRQQVMSGEEYDPKVDYDWDSVG